MSEPGSVDRDQGSARSAVARFLALAMLGPVLAAVVIRVFTDSLSPLTSTLVIAAAMPAPLLAAVVLDDRRWSSVRASVERGFRRRSAVLLVPGVLLSVWFFGALLLTFALGNVADFNGVGRLAGDVDEVRANMVGLLDRDAAGTADVPPVPALILLGLVGGIIAGLTINGLMAFGEEYGWRGYLWDRLAVYGRLGTIGGVGALWGLWHAPLILVVGYNYPDQRIAGVGAMVLFAVAASWPLDELRRMSRSAVGPAVLHGAVNGSAGVLLLLVGGDRVWAAPTGLVGALAFLPAGAAARWWRVRLGNPADESPVAV